MKSTCVLCFSIAIIISLLSCHSKTATVDNTLGVEFLDTITHFSTLSQENPADSFDFRFVNKRNFPIVVLRAETSCECTTATYDTAPIQPGDTSYIRVKYDGTGRNPEYISKSCLVSTSASNHDQLLWIEGELK